MDAASLLELLADESLPWASWPLPRQRSASRAIQTRDLHDELEQRGVQLDRRALDDLVAQVGGRREALLDPWSAPRRAVDWLRGHGWRSNDIYVFPSNVLETAGTPRKREP